MTKKKTVAFFTLGCKVNQYETDLMKEIFENNGYKVVEFDEQAYIYVINSCSVTNLSTRKTRQVLSRAKKMGGIVVLVGCYAEEIKEEKNVKNVDIVLGNEEKKDIMKYINEYIENVSDNKVIYKISDINSKKQYVQKESLKKGINVRESVKIEDGCNNFCSYCIIPYLRGRVRSRNLDEILNEVKNLVKSGVGEVVLVGIEIASYGKDFQSGISLVDVVEQVAKIDGLKRIRLGSIEPRILTDDNIERLSKIDKLCPHFHISVQSLDNSVLKKMNRKYDRQFVIDRTNKLKEKFCNLSLTCDIIVGFPGETDEEFENTLKGVRDISFYEVHTFKYSKRKWTKASNMVGQVDGNTKNIRSKKLIDLGYEQKLKIMKKYIGTRQSVLIESYKDGYLYGYTPNYMMVKIRGDESLWGCQVDVELYSVEGEMLLGKL